MAWSSLVDTVLAGTKRQQEIEVENQSEYDQWRSELYSEIEVFVKRVNSLDLEESEDRSQMYEFIEKFSNRVQDLRERSEASSAPTEALIELDSLIEELNDTSAPIAVATVSLSRDPIKKARNRRRREEREQNRIEHAREHRDEVADKIQEVNSAFDEDLE